MRSFTPRRMIGVALALFFTFLAVHVLLSGPENRLHLSHLRDLSLPPYPNVQEIFQENIDRVNSAASHINNGKAPSQPLDHAIITLSTRDDHKYKRWIKDAFPDWDVFVYLIDGTRSNLSIKNNKGREASAYLTYIVEHYDNLPEVMVFIHGKRYEWHNDDPMYATAPLIRNLRLEHVQKTGYVSLRCIWSPGCPASFRPDASQKPEANAPSFNSTAEALYADAFTQFFPGRALPAQVGAPCCSQFAVSRAQVQQRSRGDYEMYLKWVEEADGTSLHVAQAMEMMWHVIFGQPADMCAVSAEKCYCDVFGHCDLECPDRTWCKGRYWELPLQQKRLPLRWPDHGQGKGYPKEGWWKKYRPYVAERRSLEGG